MPTDDASAGFLSGIRVLELADENGEYCGRVLAGLGADVIKLEPPGGERTRAYGPFYSEVPDPNRSLYFWHYNFGKRSAIVDLSGEAGREQFRRLAASADVIIDARGYRSLDQEQLSFEVLRLGNPALIYLRITPFGEDGPWARYRGSDLVHLALGGVMANCGYDPEPGGHYDTPPIAPQMWQAYHIAGEMGVLAVLGALNYRLASGSGQRLSLAVHEAVSKNTELDLPNWIYSRSPHGRQTCRHSLQSGDKRFDLPWIAMTKDGRWMNPYRTYLQRGEASGADLLTMLVEMVEEHGLRVELDRALLSDPDYRARPEVKAYINQVTDRFINQFLYARDIWRDAQARGMPWAPIRRPEENAREVHWRQRGTFAQVIHPELGRSFTYVAGRWVCDDAPWRTSPRPPLVGEHTGEVIEELTEEVPRRVTEPSVGASRTGPPVLSPHGKPFALAGVKVVDLSWMVASGGAGRFLSCMGADVVKVEHKSRIDATRLSYGRPPLGGRAERDRMREPILGEGGINRSGFFMDMCAGKRSLSLNLKTPRGQEILARMIADADIVIEGFSPGTMQRLGFGYQRMKELNESIIYVQQSGLGERGTYGAMRSYGPTAQAFSGLSDMSGLPQPYPPAGIGYSYLDWFGAYNMATAMMAALYWRRRTGHGCHIDSSQVETGLYLTGTAILDHSANGRQWARYGNLAPHRQCAPHGAYPTSGEDRWIAIACFDDADWLSLVQVLGLAVLLDDPSYATTEQRYRNHEALDTVIGTATANWDGYQLMTQLQAAGIAAGVCQTAADRCERDPQLQHLEWLVELPQSELGTWPVKEFPVKFSETPTYMGGLVGRHGPSYGEDTEAVLGGFGFNPAEIAVLAREQVL